MEKLMTCIDLRPGVGALRKDRGDHTRQSSIAKIFTGSKSCLSSTLVAVLLAMQPATSVSEIIWEGGYESGDFSEWHNGDKTTPNLSGMPTYCRPTGPTSYYGDGSCLELVSDVTRDGRYAAKFTVKNSQNALGEPADCGGMPDCTRRIVMLKGWYAQETESGTKLPYMSERWISFSVFIPEDWDPSGSGFGPNLIELKPYINNSSVSNIFSIMLENGMWRINHRWSDVQHVSGQVRWEQQMVYAGDGSRIGVRGLYPRADAWPEGLVDYPDVAASQAALQSVNKGGWTDWILHIKFDARGSADGGTGFIELWKRENFDPWLQVLDIRPKVTTRGEYTFDHGIGYNEPPRPGPYNSFGDHGGFAIIAGVYMAKEKVWDLPENRVIYNDNIKIGDENSSLLEMAPGGPVSQDSVPIDSVPRPPTLLTVN